MITAGAEDGGGITAITGTTAIAIMTGAGQKTAIMAIGIGAASPTAEY